MKGFEVLGYEEFCSIAPDAREKRARPVRRIYPDLNSKQYIYLYNLLGHYRKVYESGSPEDAGTDSGKMMRFLKKGQNDRNMSVRVFCSHVLGEIELYCNSKSWSPNPFQEIYWSKKAQPEGARS